MCQLEIDTTDTKPDSYLTCFSWGRNDAEKLDIPDILAEKCCTRIYIR